MELYEIQLKILFYLSPKLTVILHRTKKRSIYPKPTEKLEEMYIYIFANHFEIANHFPLGHLEMDQLL